MRILFDQGTPAPLRQSLSNHHVATAYERGWATLNNGDLLDVAEKSGFEVLITTDSKLKYQQNLKARRIAIVMLSSPSWPRISAMLGTITDAVDGVGPGEYIEVQVR